MCTVCAINSAIRQPRLSLGIFEAFTSNSSWKGGVRSERTNSSGEVLGASGGTPARAPWAAAVTAPGGAALVLGNSPLPLPREDALRHEGPPPLDLAGRRRGHATDVYQTRTPVAWPELIQKTT